MHASYFIHDFNQVVINVDFDRQYPKAKDVQLEIWEMRTLRSTNFMRPLNIICVD